MKKLLVIAFSLPLCLAAQITLVNNTNPPVDSISNAFAKVNFSLGYIGGVLGSLADTDTNGIVRSGYFIAWTTNTFQTTNTVRRQLPGTFTNPASMTYSVPIGTTSPWWRYYGGDTNWNLGTITTTGVVEISFFDTDLGSLGTPINPLVSNITVYAMERPDLFGRTNKMIGQRLEVGTPASDLEAANKAYVDASVAAVNYIQNGGIYLQGANLNFNAEWTASAGTNGIVWKYLGAESLRIENPQLSYATITSIKMTNTTVWLTIWTNGVSAPPAPQWSKSLSNPSWQTLSGVTNTYPTASGTNYTISFQRPDATNAFIRVAMASDQPNFARLSALLSTAPRTVTNATDTTWGNGSGLLTWDTNYVYISVGSNQWKRAALSSW